MLFYQTVPNAPQVGVLANGNSQPAVFVQFTAVNTPASVSITHIVTAANVPAGYSVALLGLIMSNAATAAVTANIQDTAGTPVVMGNFTLPVSATVYLPPTSLPLFVTTPGKGLDWNQTAGSSIVGLTAIWCLIQQIGQL